MSFDVLHDLLQPCLTLHGHVRGHQDQLLGLENFCMLYIVSTLSLHTDRFDVLHNLLQPCFTLHGHVRVHQDQLLEVGQLLHAAHFIFFASSC